MDLYNHSFLDRYVLTFGFQGEVGLKNVGDKQGSRFLTAAYKQKLPLNLSDSEQRLFLSCQETFSVPLCFSVGAL